MIETKSSLQLISDGAHDGPFNMALDEQIFRKHIENEDPQVVLRFYRFSEPTLTVGYGMWRAANGKLPGNLVRRLTGGGIVAHTPQDLTYSLIAPFSVHPSLRKVKDSYHFIHKLLRNSLASFGLSAELLENCNSECSDQKISYCFDAPVRHDVMLAGKKIAGAGQKRSQGYLLHQGSIAWGQILRHKPELTEEDFCGRFAEKITEAIYG